MVSCWNKDILSAGQTEGGTDRTREADVLILALLFKGCIGTGESLLSSLSLLMYKMGTCVKLFPRSGPSLNFCKTVAPLSTPLPPPPPKSSRTVRLADGRSRPLLSCSERGHGLPAPYFSAAQLPSQGQEPFFSTQQPSSG